MQPDKSPLAVFVFYEDGSGVESFESLWAAWRWVEGIDVKNGEYAFITAEGCGVEATVSEKWDVTLRLSGTDRTEELWRRLAEQFPALAWTSASRRHLWLRHRRCRT